MTTFTREAPTRAWIRADIWHQDGAICSKNRKLPHIIGARGSQDLRSPSPIMAPGSNNKKTERKYSTLYVNNYNQLNSYRMRQTPRFILPSLSSPLELRWPVEGYSEGCQSISG